MDRIAVIATLLRQRRIDLVAAFLVWARMSVDEALKTLDMKREDLPDLKNRYRRASMQHHPDRGGSVEQMQRVNEAYEVLRNVRPGTTPQEREQRDELWGRATNIAEGVIGNAVDVGAFTKHFVKHIGKEFSIQDRVVKDRNSVHRFIEWTSQDRETVIDMRVHLSIATVAGEIQRHGLLGGPDVTFSVSVVFNILHDRRKSKMQPRDWQWSNRSSTLKDPEKLFPAKKLQKMVGGKDTGRRFSKRDMLLALKQRLDAKTWSSGPQIYANVPFGKDGAYTIQMYRSTMMGAAIWGMNSLARGTPGFKSAKKLSFEYRSYPEVEALLTTLIALQKKAADVDDDGQMANLAKQAFDALDRQVR